MNQEHIISICRNIWKKANQHFDWLPDMPKVTFSHKDVSYAGLFYPDSYKVEFNMFYAETMITRYTDIIIHELAHAIIESCFPDAKQSHGPEFRRVCKILGGTGSTKIITSYKYHCGCSDHKISFRHHKELQESNGTKYVECVTCKEVLIQNV